MSASCSCCVIPESHWVALSHMARSLASGRPDRFQPRRGLRALEQDDRDALRAAIDSSWAARSGSGRPPSAPAVADDGQDRLVRCLRVAGERGGVPVGAGTALDDEIGKYLFSDAPTAVRNATLRRLLDEGADAADLRALRGPHRAPGERPGRRLGGPAQEPGTRAVALMTTHRPPDDPAQAIHRERPPIVFVGGTGRAGHTSSPSSSAATTATGWCRSNRAFTSTPRAFRTCSRGRSRRPSSCASSAASGGTGFPRVRRCRPSPRGSRSAGRRAGSPR